MLKRLATVIHWLFILLGVGAGVALYNTTSPESLDKSGTWWFLLGVVAVPWLVGWVVNFVITGRSTHGKEIYDLLENAR